jgi:hypothetical protein
MGSMDILVRVRLSGSTTAFTTESRVYPAAIGLTGTSTGLLVRFIWSLHHVYQFSRFVGRMQ